MAKTEADKAAGTADAARKEAEAARAKATETGTPEDDKKARAAEQKADDALAKEQEARHAEIAEREPEEGAAEHEGQTFGNKPSNPKLAPGVDPDGAKVRLSRVTPDKAEPEIIDVPEAMVGDYLRAGWTKDVSSPYG